MKQPAFLRVRPRGAEVEIRTAPFVQSGRLGDMIEEKDGGIVTMQVGRTTMEFFVEDFAALFGGYEHARRLLGNAAEHKDFVEIRVLRERLSYHNPAQYARVPKA